MKRHKADTPTVSFRLDEHHHALLAEHARAFDMSPGEYARVLVRDAITDQHAQRTLHELTELKHHLPRTLLDLEELKSNLCAEHRHLRNATFCLLVDYGDAAREFIDKHMAD